MDDREQQQPQHHQQQRRQQQQQQQEQQDQRQIDENGRCTLHPGIQLHLLKKNGEWRVLLTACPLCVSGLPATGKPVKIRRAASSSSSIMSFSAIEKEEGHIQQQWGAEVAEIVPYGGSGNKRGGGGSKEEEYKKNRQPSYPKSPRWIDAEEDNKSNLSEAYDAWTSEEQSPLALRDLSGEGEFKGGKTTPERKRSDITPPLGKNYNQSMPTTPSRPTARPRTPSPQTPLLHRMKLLQVGGENISDHGGQQCKQDQINTQRVMNNYEKNQHELLYSSMGASVTHRGNDYSAADTADSPLPQVNITANEEDVDEAHSDQSHYVYNQIQQPLPFPNNKRGMNNVLKGKPRDDSFYQSCQSQLRALHNPHIPFLPQKIQQVHQANQSHTLRSLPSMWPPTARVGDREQDEIAGRPPTRDKTSKRPDPEDADEFTKMFLDGGISGHLHQPQAHFSSPIHPGLPPTLSSHHPERGEYANHQREQSRYISDEVSVMSMSSVIRNMHNSQRRQLEEQQQEQLYQQNFPGSDVSHNRSYSEFTTKSSNSIQKSQSSSSLVSSSDVVEREENITQKKTKENHEDIINTFDYDERGWCRRHPATVRLRKKKMMRGGWQVLLSQCPECCLDEIRRIQLLGSKKTKISNRSRKSRSSTSRDGGSVGGVSGVSSKSSVSKASIHKKEEEEAKKKNNKIMKKPPISQLSLHSRSVGYDSKKGSDYCVDARSVGTASTITMSTYTHSSVGGRVQNDLNDDGGVGAIAFVTRMPYTDINGEYGWYTGQVNSSTGDPHGIGTMNYANGFVIYEVGWHNGVYITGGNRDKEEKMPVGDTISRRQHHVTPRTPQQGMRTHLATLNEDEKSVNYKYADSSSSENDSSSSRSPLPDLPQQQQERAVVCGMLWTDLNGDDGVYTGEVNYLKYPDGMGSLRYDYGMVVEGVWRDGEFIYDEEDDNNSGNDDDFVISHEKSLSSFFSSG